MVEIHRTTNAIRQSPTFKWVFPRTGHGGGSGASSSLEYIAGTHLANGIHSFPTRKRNTVAKMYSLNLTADLQGWVSS